MPNCSGMSVASAANREKVAACNLQEAKERALRERKSLFGTPAKKGGRRTRRNRRSTRRRSTRRN
jgi:hypothetical protein